MVSAKPSGVLISKARLFHGVSWGAFSIATPDFVAAAAS
jgi:hypothetical protein